MEKTVTKQDNQGNVAMVSEAKVTPHSRVIYLIYFIFGLIEAFLAFRFVLKLLGANPGSPFVDFIYTLTQIFVWPFEGIFRRGFTQGIETTSVIEPSTLVAMAVYPLLCWVIIKLIAIISGKPAEELE